MENVNKYHRSIGYYAGWPTAAGQAAYFSVVAFALRLILGSHSFAQAGTEALAVAAGMFLAYCFGYYANIFNCRATFVADALRGNHLKLTNTRRFWWSVGTAALTFLGGCYVHSLIGAAFTSNIWLSIYAVAIACSLWTAVRDREVQKRIDAGIALSRA
jgi:hypothetical protein